MLLNLIPYFPFIPSGSFTSRPCGSHPVRPISVLFLFLIMVGGWAGGSVGKTQMKPFQMRLTVPYSRIEKSYDHKGLIIGALASRIGSISVSEAMRRK